MRRARSPSDGKFDSFAGVIGNAELNAFFSGDAKKRIVEVQSTFSSPARPA